VVQYGDLVLKIEDDHAESRREHEMLAWLQGRLPVPSIIASTMDHGRRYLLTSRLPGRMACAKENLADITNLIDVLADALRLLWEVDTTSCPQRRTLDTVLVEVEHRLNHGQIDMDDVDSIWVPKRFPTLASALTWLNHNRPVEDLVFSHGDCCLPNLFVTDGRLCGVLDLGRSGIADRYQDIALLLRSLRYNLGHRWDERYEMRLFDRLGCKPDRHKITYYTLLDEFF
jgi:kanamycin kinase/aminoglycoside 3'-phosphotransferase-3